eukprot:11625979-Alexandrium_andersonii.AAC.1
MASLHTARVLKSTQLLDWGKCCKCRGCKAPLPKGSMRRRRAGATAAASSDRSNPGAAASCQQDDAADEAEALWVEALAKELLQNHAAAAGDVGGEDEQPGSASDCVRSVAAASADCAERELHVAMTSAAADPSVAERVESNLLASAAADPCGFRDFPADIANTALLEVHELPTVAASLQEGAAQAGAPRARDVLSEWATHVMATCNAIAMVEGMIADQHGIEPKADKSVSLVLFRRAEHAEHSGETEAEAACESAWTQFVHWDNVLDKRCRRIASLDAHGRI